MTSIGEYLLEEISNKKMGVEILKDRQTDSYIEELSS